MPDIVHYIAQLAGYEIADWMSNGNLLLGIMILFVQLPLAFLKKIDFLGFTSFIGMGCMMSFVGLVVSRQDGAAEQCGNITYIKPGPEPVCEVEQFIMTIKSAYAIPSLLFAFMCHGNILPIVAELKPSEECNSRYPSPKRLRQMIFGMLTHKKSNVKIIVYILQVP